MRRFLATVVAFVCSCALFAQAPPPKKPKLVLGVVVDQFRYDYLNRFRADYTSGFKRILEQGAVFDDAHHIHFPTVTAVGHSTFMSGATPSLSGIVSNEWYDRDADQKVTSVSDPQTKLIGVDGGQTGSSPRRMLVSTVGDEIKMQGQKAKVIGISIKDRSAILPAGHMADAAYWFDAAANRWVTSSYYMQKLPGWVDQVNESKPYLRASGKSWYALDAKPGDKPLCSMVKTPGVRTCGSLEATPWGNELIEEFAERALVEEKMGHHEGTDVLTVSFSSNDYVGHAVGPDDPAVRDIAIRTDRMLGKLFDAVDRSVGLDNVVFVMTADHGVSPVPEVNQARRMPGGRLDQKALFAAIQQALESKYGPGKWIVGNAGPTPYLNQSLIASRKLSEADVQRTAADAVRAMPHVFRVYTPEQLQSGQVLEDYISVAVRNGYYRKRSGDLLIIPEDYYLYEATGTSHGTPFNYDTHVPVIFMGPGLKHGHYYQRIAVNDIAPTLAAILGVEEPSGSVGRVLQEMWQ
ncbi:MAG TPA: alkaline phosphatase family protein [Bryobacteraceae bacterium]|nr:alkaline phosphatase family protein [Bryobacteraceae bacterium]